MNKLVASIPFKVSEEEKEEQAPIDFSPNKAQQFEENYRKERSSKDDIRFVKIPISLQTGFLQYLSFFDEFIQLTRGEKIKLSIRKTSGGLEIQFIDSSLSNEEISSYLKEYTEYLYSNIHTNKITIPPIEVNNNRLTKEEFDDVILSLKSEISHFKEKYALAKNRVLFLEDKFSQFVSGFKSVLSNVPMSISLEENKKSKRKLKELLSFNKFDELFSILLDFNLSESIENEIYSYKGRLNQLQEEERKNLISRSDYEMHKNKVVNSILKLIDTLGK